MMRSGAIALAAIIIAVVAMMIVPLPTPLLDLLITSNLAISVALLLVARVVGADPRAFYVSNAPTAHNALSDWRSMFRPSG